MGILSRSGALLLPRFFRHRSYVSESKYVWSGIWGCPRSSMVKPYKSYQGYYRTLHVQYCGCVVWCAQMETVGRLLMDCCRWISCAISSGLVKMLFCLSTIESRGDVLEFLKTIMFTFLGIFSYNCLYFDIAFDIHYLVYFVVMFLACFLAVFAMAEPCWCFKVYFVGLLRFVLFITLEL